jgi:hypothetical protein
VKVPYTRNPLHVVLWPDDTARRQCWPDPTSEALSGALDRAIYSPGTIRSEDLLLLCSVASAYHALVIAPAGVKYRDESLRALRRACLDAARREVEK